MRPTLALATLDTLTSPHHGGHRCTNGDWYNDRVGYRTVCPVLRDLTTLREQVEALHAQVHEAAHDDDVARYVGAAAAGFTGADCDRAHPDDQAGFTQMGRYAIEALCTELDRDPIIEARAAAVRERLAAAGLHTPDQ